MQDRSQTGGELLRFDLFVRPGGFVAGDPHIHPHQDERFVVRRGTVRLHLDGEERDYIAGEEAHVPRGVPHAWWNAGDDELHAVVELRPAMQFEGFITTHFAVAQAGKVDARGNANLLQAAVMMRKYGDTIVATELPPSVLKVLFAVLTPLARMLGYTADVPYVEGPPPSTEVARVP